MARTAHEFPLACSSTRHDAERTKFKDLLSTTSPAGVRHRVGRLVWRVDHPVDRPRARPWARRHATPAQMYGLNWCGTGWNLF